MQKLTRRSVVIAAGAGLVGALPSVSIAQGLPAPPDERIFGDPAAPVTVIEYHSLTCGNCQNFYMKVMPEIKREFIDTGKVKFAYREFPLDRVALTASILAYCSGSDDRYFAFIDTFYRTKEQWAHDKDPIKKLGMLGALGGVPLAKFQQCQDDKTFVDAILQQRMKGEKEFKVQGTPTFVIDGKTYRGSMEFAEFAKILRPLIKN